MDLLSPRALRRLASLCAVCGLFALAASARADDPPAFGNADLTALVKEYAALNDQNVTYAKDYVLGCMANDQAKWEAAMNKANGLQTKRSELYTKINELRDKLKPEETKKLDDFFADCEKKMDDAQKYPK